jgi:anaphase-promoting complex subunit 11
MKVKINSWNAVAAWKWDLDDNDACTICMTSYESPCPSCKLPGDDCPPVEGNCSHFFHLHCIYKWLNSGNENFLLYMVCSV